MAKSKLAVGLDIGSSSVKLVQLKEKRDGFVLQAFASAPLPPEAIVDGALMNSAATAAEHLEPIGRREPQGEDDLALGVHAAIEPGLDARDGERRDAGLARELRLREQLLLAEPLHVVRRAGRHLEFTVLERSNGHALATLGQAS